jgi:raffinose/stachyose/melibiose transport system substrate-binding protein
MKKVLMVMMSVLLVTLMVPGVYAADKIKLTMLEYQDLNDAVEMANFEELMDAFAKLHPDVELEMDFGFSEAYHDKLRTVFAGGELPDIMFLWPGKRTGYVTSSGMVKDLSPWIKGHEAEFAAGALNAQGPNGEIYELPEQMTATHVMFTNEKLLDDLGLTFPKTLDELIAQGETIRAAGLIPIAMDNKDGWQMQSCLLSALTERAGGIDWYNKAIKGDGASFADAEFINALSVIDTLAKNEMFSPGINQADYGVALTDFVTEKAVYLIDGGWRVNNLVGELTDDQKPFIKLNTLPEIPNQKGQAGSTAMVAGTGYGMNANLEGEKAEAAWKWIWFYSGPEGAKIRQKQGALTAYNLPVSDDMDVLIKRLNEFVAGTPSGYVIDAVMDAEGMGGLHAGLQEMILGKKTPEQVAQEYEAWVAENDSARK